MATTPVVSSPKARYFHDAVIAALGILTSFEAGKFVGFNLVIGEVFNFVDLDPWSPSLDRKAIDRKIGFAFRNQREGYCGQKAPLTIQGPKKGLWGLTPQGVNKARAIVARRQPLKTLKNATSKWIEQQGDKLLDAMYRAVARKLPLSNSMDLCWDHVNNCIVRLIRRDSLKRHLTQGKKIHLSQVASWAVRSSFTDIRGWGTDAACRELRGALTEQNRKNREEQEIEVRPTSSFQGSDKVVEVDDWGSYLIDIADPTDSIESVEEKIHFQKVWKQIHAVVMSHFADRDAPTYVRVAQLLCMGMKAKEVSSAVNVPYDKANSLVADVRRALRSARNRGRLPLLGSA